MHQLVIFIFNKRFFSPFRWLATGRANRNVCKAYDVLFPDGYCKHILGNSAVFGKTMEDLQNKEQKLLRTLEFLRLTLIVPQLVSESCFAGFEDIYCHNYFPRCYISSSPQPVCREACEGKFFLKVCDHLIKWGETINKENLEKGLFFSRHLKVDDINCTTLPYRNQTSNCYYPDVIQG